MTLLFTVYDTHGEPFEVRPDLAKNLVIGHGWSLEPNAPKIAPAPAPVQVAITKPAVVVNLQPDEVQKPVTAG
jgi:hypothetical protein